MAARLLLCAVILLTGCGKTDARPAGLVIAKTVTYRITLHVPGEKYSDEVLCSEPDWQRAELGKPWPPESRPVEGR